MLCLAGDTKRAVKLLDGTKYRATGSIQILGDWEATERMNRLRWGGVRCVVCVVGGSTSVYQGGIVRAALQKHFFADWKDSQLVLRSPRFQFWTASPFKAPLALCITAAHPLQKHFNSLLCLELVENSNEKENCLKAATAATNVAEGPRLNWNLNSSRSNNQTNPPPP